MNVDSTSAKKVLAAAFASASSEGFKPHSPHRAAIQRIINGSHKTYKYILLTALLAKTTNSGVNPLTLQSGSRLSGAFDARSLCHRVVVPFERESLANALGGSNEPFLNKPARFPEIALSNAVRRGADRKALVDLHGVLRQVDSSALARTCLQDTLFEIIQLGRERVSYSGKTILVAPKQAELERFVLDLVEESLEGESLALATGGLLVLLKGLYDDTFVVKEHPVNQSGASSREVSDIDVYAHDKLIYCVEAKDKPFSAADVEHACRKAADSGATRLCFVFGPRAELVGTTDVAVRTSAASFGIYLTLFSLSDFAKSVLALMPPMDTREFYGALRNWALTKNFKAATISRLNGLGQSYGWI